MPSRWLALALVALAGCSGVETATPTPAPRPVLVTSPALEPLVTGWLENYVSETGPLAFDLEIRAPSAPLAPGETRIQGTPPAGTGFATPLGREAVAVIVNLDVPKRDFSLAELVNLFSGRTETWDSLKGGLEAVQPVIPLPDDSLRLDFEGAVMGSTPFASGALLASSPASLVDLVAGTPGAIGLAPLSQAAEGVKVVRVEGKLADADRLDSTDYRLIIEVVAVGQSVPDTHIYDFLQWRQMAGGPDQP